MQESGKLMIKRWTCGGFLHCLPTSQLSWIVTKTFSVNTMAKDLSGAFHREMVLPKVPGST